MAADVWGQPLGPFARTKKSDFLTLQEETSARCCNHTLYNIPGLGRSQYAGRFLPVTKYFLPQSLYDKNVITSGWVTDTFYYMSSLTSSKSLFDFRSNSMENPVSLMCEYTVAKGRRDVQPEMSKRFFWEVLLLKELTSVKCNSPSQPHILYQNFGHFKQPLKSPRCCFLSQFSNFSILWTLSQNTHTQALFHLPLLNCVHINLNKIQ